MAVHGVSPPTWGVRRRYKGKMGFPVKLKGGKTKLVPRSHHVDNKLAAIKWENSQREPLDTQHAPKCEAPKSRKQGRGIGGNCRPIGAA
jgi:hypothetical protein